MNLMAIWDPTPIPVLSDTYCRHLKGNGLGSYRSSVQGGREGREIGGRRTRCRCCRFRQAPRSCWGRVSCWTLTPGKWRDRRYTLSRGFTPYGAGATAPQPVQRFRLSLYSLTESGTWHIQNSVLWAGGPCRGQPSYLSAGKLVRAGQTSVLVRDGVFRCFSA